MDTTLRVPKWNTFTISDDKLIEKDKISKTIGSINEKLNIHERRNKDDKR